MMQQGVPPVIQSVYDLIRRDLGGLRVTDRENPEIATIGTTAATLFRANSARVAFIIVNLSGNIMFVRPSRPAATTAGIRLGANGGFLAAHWKEDLLLPSREWAIIADAGAGNQLYSLEVVLL
jgi:hypothetical protein